MSELSDLVKSAREARGLRQNKLANILDVTPTIINRIECGSTQKPSVDVLHKLSWELNLDFIKSLKLTGRPEDYIDSVRKELYSSIAQFQHFDHLLFLLSKMSETEYGTFVDALAKSYNLSKEDKELVLGIINSLSHLSDKEKSVIKMLIS